MGRSPLKPIPLGHLTCRNSALAAPACLQAPAKPSLDSRTKGTPLIRVAQHLRQLPFDGLLDDFPEFFDSHPHQRLHQAWSSRQPGSTPRLHRQYSPRFPSAQSTNTQGGPFRVPHLVCRRFSGSPVLLRSLAPPLPCLSGLGARRSFDRYPSRYRYRFFVLSLSLSALPLVSPPDDRDIGSDLGLRTMGIRNLPCRTRRQRLERPLLPQSSTPCWSEYGTISPRSPRLSRRLGDEISA